MFCWCLLSLSLSLVFDSLRGLIALAQGCQTVSSHFPGHGDGSWGPRHPPCLCTPWNIAHTLPNHSVPSAWCHSGECQGWPRPLESRMDERQTGRGGKRRCIDGHLGSQTARCCQLTSPPATVLWGESGTCTIQPPPAQAHTFSCGRW